MKHKLPTSLKLLFIIGLMLGIYHFLSPLGVIQRFAKIGQRASAITAAPPPVLSPLQLSQMAGKINSTITANSSMQIGVAIEDLNNDKQYTYGVTQPFIAASISKVLTATMYLHEVETGQYSLGQDVGGYSARYELQQLIEQSDNTAWASLNDLLSHDGLESYAGSIGLSNYDPDQNTLTVNDIALLLSKLYKHQLLNSANTQLLLSYMKNANEDSYIVASVPAGVKIYHKAGWLVDRVHDAAIIDNSKHPYVLVIFTKDNSGTYDSAQGQQIFADITTATTQAFL